LPMEHDLVALKFGRKLAPLLELKFQALATPKAYAATPLMYGEAMVRVLIVNLGRRVARHVQLIIFFPPRELVSVIDRSGHTTLVSALYQPRQAMQVKDDIGVSHPHMSTSTAEIGIALHEEFVQNHADDPLIEWIVYADEMDPQTGVVRLADLGWDKLEPLPRRLSP
jgi:hypothetical protein